MAVAISFRERYPYPSDNYDRADEHFHQVCYFEFLRMEWRAFYNSCYAIPNGGTRNRVEAANMKMEGVKAGVCDVFHGVPMLHPAKHPGGRDALYAGLYVEMKKPNGSYGVSDKQTEFMNDQRARGYAVGVAYGWFQAVGLWLYYVGVIGAQEAAQRYSVDTSPEVFGKGIQI